MSVMRVAVTTVPDFVPVTKIRSPVAMDATETVFVVVTRVVLVVVTFTVAFVDVFLTVSVSPLIEAMVPEVPGRPPRPVRPPYPPAVAAPAVATGVPDLCDNALAPKNPPTTSTIATAVLAAATQRGRLALGC
jgi:hypothetical protein